MSAVGQNENQNEKVVGNEDNANNVNGNVDDNSAAAKKEKKPKPNNKKASK